MQTLDVAEFIAACADGDMPVDFVSSHFYPTDPQCQTNETKDDIDCFTEICVLSRYNDQK